MNTSALLSALAEIEPPADGIPVPWFALALALALIYLADHYRPPFTFERK